MPYCTEVELLQVITAANLAILTGDPTGTTIDSVRTALACANASEEIDLILVKRFNVPIDPPIVTAGTIIQSFCVDIAFFNLYKMEYRDVDIPSTILWARINALAELKKIASGERDLNAPVADDIIESAKQNQNVSFSGNMAGRIITNDDLDDFFPSPY